jgi:ectoine hydroxylase-related dioxygenase (phytanoyl-CoA dioxygenase family)
MTIPAADIAGAIEEKGYAIVEGALSAGELARYRSTLDALAEDATREGYRYHVTAEGFEYAGAPDAPAPMQRVWNLLGKDAGFFDLIDHPLVEATMPAMLGRGFILSDTSANIVQAPGDTVFLHADQEFMPKPWPWAGPMAATIIWMLDDFTEENGATLVVPGSHRRHETPPAEGKGEAMVSAIGPAGSALVMDGRTWHSTGLGTAASFRRRGILGSYCRPFLRGRENYVASLGVDAVAALPDRHRYLVGGVPYKMLGGVDGQPLRSPNG